MELQYHTKNIFIDVDAKELNNVLNSNGHTQFNDDDNDEINIKYMMRMKTNQQKKRKNTISINYFQCNVNDVKLLFSEKEIY